MDKLNLSKETSARFQNYRNWIDEVQQSRQRSTVSVTTIKITQENRYYRDIFATTTTTTSSSSSRNPSTSGDKKYYNDYQKEPLNLCIRKNK